LDALRPLIAAAANLKSVRLIDAHSFCWLLSTLIKQEADGTLGRTSGGKGEGRIFTAREKSIVAMRMSVESTARNSNGQMALRTIKNKELRMTSEQLEKHITWLLDIQKNRCALTGLPFQFLGSDSDRNLLPSVDRKDSNGHYEIGNPNCLSVHQLLEKR
jgi:hypothetical protein